MLAIYGPNLHWCLYRLYDVAAYQLRDLDTQFVGVAGLR